MNKKEAAIAIKQVTDECTSAITFAQGVITGLEQLINDAKTPSAYKTKFTNILSNVNGHLNALNSIKTTVESYVLSPDNIMELLGHSSEAIAIRDDLQRFNNRAIGLKKEMK